MMPPFVFDGTVPPAMEVVMGPGPIDAGGNSRDYWDWLDLLEQPALRDELAAESAGALAAGRNHR